MSAAALRANIVAVGSELVSGDVLDTNSAWLAQRLVEVGVDVGRITVVGDDADDLDATLRAAISTGDVVLVAGGLGPTADDLTRFAVARVAGVDLERRADLAAGIASYYAERGREMPALNLVQADLPVGAEALAAVGTAPGFATDVGDTLVICVPGVPSELREMTARSVVPLLQRRHGLTVRISRTVNTAGLGESDVAERCAELVDRLAAAGQPRLAFLASRGQVRVQVVARGADVASARALVDPVVDDVVALLGPSVVGLDDEGVEHAVARLLERHGWTLAVAESITGGGVGARLVTVPGASTWFAGGLVAYATSAKTVLGGVSESLLATHGPVSEPTALALATAARDRLRRDVSWAVVGVAGPTTKGSRPVGTVCLASVVPGGAHARSLSLPPRSREDLQQFSATAALEFLRRRLAVDGGA